MASKPQRLSTATTKAAGGLAAIVSRVDQKKLEKSTDRLRESLRTIERSRRQAETKLMSIRLK